MAAGSTGCAFAAIALASTLTASPGRPDPLLEVELDFALEMVAPKHQAAMRPSPVSRKNVACRLFPRYMTCSGQPGITNLAFLAIAPLLALV